MRVIRNCTKEIEKKVICKNCASELGYLPKDIQKKTFQDYSGCSDTYNIITCPVCSKEIYV